MKYKTGRFIYSNYAWYSTRIARIVLVLITRITFIRRVRECSRRDENVKTMVYGAEVRARETNDKVQRIMFVRTRNNDLNVKFIRNISINLHFN